MKRKSLEPWLRDEVDFFPHQIEGVRLMVKRRNPIMADDMGLGKSLQAIATFAVDVKMGWGDTLLVVCPVSLKDNWAKEFRKHTRIPYTILGQRVNSRGKTVKTGRIERIQQIVEFALGSGPRALIVNYEQVAPHIEEINACGIHMAVFDEVHYLGNFDSQRTAACLMVKSNRKVPMTGTLIRKHVNNLWPIFRMVDKRTPKYNTFMNRYAVYGGYNNGSVIGVKNKDELHEFLETHMIRRLKSDVLKDLPPVHKIPVFVRLTDEQQKLYDEVVNEMQLTTSFDPENPLEVENALTKMLRLKQICGSTFSFTGEDYSNKLDDAAARVAELTENGHKVVVFTQFRDILALFAERVSKIRGGTVPVWQLHGDVSASARFDVTERWSASLQPGVLASMIQVGAEGLNMVAARHGIFLDETYVPATNNQAIDRMHRIGQGTQPVTIWRYETIGTVEERIREICVEKNTTFDEIVNEPMWKGQLVREVLGTRGGEPTASASHAQMTIGDVAS